MTDEELTKYIGLYHGTVFRLAFSYIKNREEAEDICQEAFIKLYESRVEFAAPDNCKAWLIRVTINLSKNLLRSARFARTDELDENVALPDEQRRELLESVMRLPPAYRAVIHLYYYEGYSVKEIADMTGTSVSATTTRLSRGRERLKKLLE